MSIKELLLRQEAEIQSKRVKQEEKESESLLGKGQQLMQRYVETVDHSAITSKYLETFIADASQGRESGPDEDFEKLYALNLPPEVTVRHCIRFLSHKAVRHQSFVSEVASARTKLVSDFVPQH